MQSHGSVCRVNPKNRIGRHRAGFSLAELLVVVTIILVASAAAVPMLQGRVNQARRGGATMALARLCLAQERFYINYDRYAETFNELGAQLGSGERIDHQTFDTGDYTYSLVTFDRRRPGDSFEIVATANLDLSDPILDILMIEGGAPVVAPKEMRNGCVIIVSDDIHDSSTRIRR
jgi:prepilin-type N-terminal cleavage/methylation domain-containing protein